MARSSDIFWSLCNGVLATRALMRGCTAHHDLRKACDRHPSLTVILSEDLNKPAGELISNCHFFLQS